MTVRRSPYLILGLPFGATKAEASRAFAKATRRLRTADDAPYDIEDLNWALHQIEQRDEDPALSIADYRFPGDPEVYEVPDGPGVLNPPEVRYRRRTPPTDQSTLADLRLQLVREVAAQVAAGLRSQPLPPLHVFEEEGHH